MGSKVIVFSLKDIITLFWVLLQWGRRLDVGDAVFVSLEQKNFRCIGESIEFYVQNKIYYAKQCTPSLVARESERFRSHLVTSQAR